MMIFSETHDATNVGAGNAARDTGRSTLHVHTAEFLCDSGTGSATVTHYGRNGNSGSWYAICTFTFTAAANGEKATPQTLEHNWDQYKSECSALSGTGARVLTTMSGA